MQRRSLCLAPIALSYICLAFGLQGCSAVDSNLEHRFSGIEDSMAVSRNKLILLNIVRASYDEPLSFVDVPSVSGTLNETVSAGLPSFSDTLEKSIDGKKKTLKSTAVSSISHDMLGSETYIGNNYSVTTLNNKEFMGGIVNPVSLKQIYLLIQQGWSREMVFDLFTESFTYNKKLLVNTPDKQDSLCQDSSGTPTCFKGWVNYAVQGGLTVKSGQRDVTIKRTVKFTRQKDASFESQEATQEEQIQDEFVLCIDPALSEHTLINTPHDDKFRKLKNDPGRVYKWSPLCNQIISNGFYNPKIQKRTLIDSDDFEIQQRSILSVYRYLGALLRIHLSTSAQIGTKSNPDSDLISIEINKSTDCFSNIRYYGNNYCVPISGSEKTKKIFAILSLLQTLQTSTQDLSIAPSIRLVQ